MYMSYQCLVMGIQIQDTVLEICMCLVDEVFLKSDHFKHNLQAHMKPDIDNFHIHLLAFASYPSHNLLYNAGLPWSHDSTIPLQKCLAYCNGTAHFH